MSQQFQERQHLPDTFSPVVLVPTYNNADTLLSVLEKIDLYQLTVIVINDGSEDATAEILAKWVIKHYQKRLVITHAQNQGKAAALQSGFAFARAKGYTHALTIDSDGQHDAADIPAFIATARSNPRSLILGMRQYDLDSYPGKNKLGRFFSNLAIQLECGLRVSDSQCGFRVYPLGLLAGLRCVSGRYAFEAEILTRSGWAGAGAVQCPASCRYEIPEARRVTHFRPWLDTTHGLCLHAYLLLRAMMPVGHAHLWHDPNGRVLRRADDRPRWRRLLHWLNPLRAWRELRRGGLRRGELATGLAMGVFIGAMPVYGLHTVMCLYTAAKLHLNPHVTVVGSALFATPPQAVLLIATSIATGQFMMHGELIYPVASELSALSWLEIAGRFMLEWAVGSLVVGFVLAVLTWFAGYALFGTITRRSPDQAEDGLAVAEVVEVDAR